MKPPFLVTLLALSALSLGGVAAAQTAPSAKAQKAALHACKTSLGVGGGAQYTTSWASRTAFGGTTVVTIKPYDQVTPALANQINACAARSLGTAAPAPVVAEVSVAPRADAQVAAQPAQVAPQARAGCVMGAGVLQRGTLICPGH